MSVSGTSRGDSARNDARSRRLQRAAEELRAAVRRQDGQESPVGPRALRTRDKLLAVAAELFTAQGYLATAMPDIAKAAGVSLGTVYQYFADRNDIVATLAAESALRMLDRGADDWDAHAGRLGLRRAIAALVTLNWENRSFFALWETATHVDQRLADLRRELGAHFRHRFAVVLNDATEAGLVRPGLDAEEVARALVLMVTSYCFDTFVFDPPDTDIDIDAVTDMLTSLWSEAIGLREPSELRRQRR
jgi:AcrR family transcriptional regulator